MHMADAHTCTLAPGGGASTLDTTDPPNCMEPTWAQDSPTAPGSQTFPRRLRLKCQSETHLCNMQVAVQYPWRWSLVMRFRLKLLNWSHHITERAICVFAVRSAVEEEADAAGERQPEAQR